jgi:hypothetical protein
MLNFEKDAAKRKAADDKRYKKRLAELERYVKKIKVPDGFSAAWVDDDWDRSHKVFVVKKEGEVELIFRPGCDGTTKFKAGGTWRSFDRRGVESSFYWAPLYDGDERPSADDLIAGELRRVADKVAYYETAVKVPDVGYTVSPDGVARLKKELKERGYLSFSPSGFGTGYRVLKKRPAHSYGVRRAKPELENFLEVSPLWIESFDAD